MTDQLNDMLERARRVSELLQKAMRAMPVDRDKVGAAYIELGGVIGSIQGTAIYWDTMVKPMMEAR
jgi:hypothetical protein